MTSPTPRHVAAFDFDGTVSKRDTLVPFLARVAGPSRFAAVCGRLGLHGARKTVDIRNRDDIKAAMLRLLFAGHSEDELRTRGERYAGELLRGRLRPFVVDRVRHHVERGDDTLFVSASLVYYLEPIAEHFGLRGVIGVEPEVRDGRLTGELARPNVRAEEKAVRLREWLDAPPEGELHGVELWAYGNTSGDHALLDLARHRFWLGKAKRVPAGVQVLHPGTPL